MKLTPAAAILTSAGHDVDTVTRQGLTGALDRHVAAAATAAGPILISLHRGPGDIRAHEHLASDRCRAE